MKAVCISACEVDGLGIVWPGQHVELHDGYALDERINQHFVIDKKSIKDPDAKVPDFNGEMDGRREAFKSSLANETEWLKALNALIDTGATVPAEVSDRTDATLTDEERRERLVELWTDSFGWKFPTDGEGDAKGGQSVVVKENEKVVPKPKKSQPKEPADELFNRRG